MSTSQNKLDRQTLRALSKPSILHWLKSVVSDWGVLLVTIFLVCLQPNWLTIIVGMVVIGNRQHGLAILGHEGTHGRIASNRRVNDLLSNIFCFWPIGLTASGYRKLHNQHHRNTGSHHDPELAHKRSRSPQWDLPASPIRILKYAFLDVIGLSLPDYYIIVTYSKPDKKQDYLPLLLWHILFVGAFVFTDFWWVPILWYVGLVTTFMMFFRLRLWLEHQGTTETHRLHLTALEGALLAPHNIWYHWEHHKYSSIPFYRLPQVRGLLHGVPVQRLQALLEFFNHAPRTKSGEVL